MISMKEDYITVHIPKAYLGKILPYVGDPISFIKELNISKDNYFSFPAEVRRVYVSNMLLDEELVASIIKMDKSHKVLWNIYHWYARGDTVNCLSADSIVRRREIFKKACALLGQEDIHRVVHGNMFHDLLRGAVFKALPLEVLPIYIGLHKESDLIIHKRIQDNQ